jgi:hypothetical protein
MEVRMSKKSLLLACVLAATTSFVSCARKQSPKKDAGVQQKASIQCSQEFVTEFTNTNDAIALNQSQPSSVGYLNGQCDKFTSLKTDKCQVDCTKLSDKAKADYCPKKDKTLIPAADLITFCNKYKAAHPGPAAPTGTPVPPGNSPAPEPSDELIDI